RGVHEFGIWKQFAQAQEAVRWYGRHLQGNASSLQPAITQCRRNSLRDVRRCHCRRSRLADIRPGWSPQATVLNPGIGVPDDAFLARNGGDEGAQHRITWDPNKTQAPLAAVLEQER